MLSDAVRLVSCPLCLGSEVHLSRPHTEGDSVMLPAPLPALIAPHAALVAPLLAPVLTGKHAVTLYEVQQRDLARWATIKALLMERALR